MTAAKHRERARAWVYEDPVQVLSDPAKHVESLAALLAEVEREALERAAAIIAKRAADVVDPWASSETAYAQGKVSDELCSAADDIRYEAKRVGAEESSE